MRNRIVPPLLIVLAACHGSTEPVPSDTGIIVLVTKGPIDPVEVEGQSTNTAPVPAARVAVRPVAGGDVETATTGDDGLARLLVAPGDYVVSVEVCPGAMSLPKETGRVTVTSAEFAVTMLVCDTGIR